MGNDVLAAKLDNHIVCIGPPCFIVFNSLLLNMDSIDISDIAAVKAGGSVVHRLQSMAWSADIRWFFLARPDSVLLLQWHSAAGLLCRRPSAMFIGFCLEHRLLDGRSMERPGRATRQKKRGAPRTRAKPAAGGA